MGGPKMCVYVCVLAAGGGGGRGTCLLNLPLYGVYLPVYLRLHTICNFLRCAL